ncbi:glycosyltransferase family 2 protein [Aliiroseovarius sp. YM-037]|uniref:glycosyltransferase family 2 protein n=1 Tax=Aliiroseovarius sp. YM-037 TaxID=3341728 RepID=UPI003A809B8C
MQINPISVAFVLPCLNEVRTIEWCVKRALEALALINQRFGLSGEVIVADNGSTDGSQEVARNAGARVVPVSEKGYGAALQGGFESANADYLVMGDSDCSYDFVEALPMVEKLLEGADLCMGSRFAGEIKPGAMPWKNRYIGNPALSGMLRFLFNTNITDAHCGMRALTRDAYDRLKLSSTGMEFASEMVLKSVLMKLKLAEVPITLSQDQRGRPPHLSPWRDGFRHLIYMLLLSPTWLFMAPAALMFVVGAVLMAFLVAAGDSEIVWLGSLRFGDHWAIAASASLIISLQTALMGVYALLNSYREGFRQPGKWAMAILGTSRLQYWLAAGMLLMAAGLSWAFWIAAGWAASEFGPLDSMRALIAAATTIVIGSQIFFSGFLISVFSGNRSRHGLGI